MEKFTPKQLENMGERADSDTELRKEGAKYVQDVDPKTGEYLEPRLDITKDQLLEKEIWNEIFGDISQEVRDAFFKDDPYNKVLEIRSDLGEVDVREYDNKEWRGRQPRRIIITSNGHVYGDTYGEQVNYRVEISELSDSAHKDIIRVFKKRVEGFTKELASKK